MRKKKSIWCCVLPWPCLLALFAMSAFHFARQDSPQHQRMETANANDVCMLCSTPWTAGADFSSLTCSSKTGVVETQRNKNVSKEIISGSHDIQVRYWLMNDIEMSHSWVILRFHTCKVDPAYLKWGSNEFGACTHRNGSLKLIPTTFLINYWPESIQPWSGSQANLHISTNASFDSTTFANVCICVNDKTAALYRQRGEE